MSRRLHPSLIVFALAGTVPSALVASEPRLALRSPEPSYVAVPKTDFRLVEFPLPGSPASRFEPVGQRVFGLNASERRLQGNARFDVVRASIPAQPIHLEPRVGARLTEQSVRPASRSSSSWIPAAFRSVALQFGGGPTVAGGKGRLPGFALVVGSPMRSSREQSRWMPTVQRNSPPPANNARPQAFSRPGRAIR